MSCKLDVVKEAPRVVGLSSEAFTYALGVARDSDRDKISRHCIRVHVITAIGNEWPMQGSQ